MTQHYDGPGGFELAVAAMRKKMEAEREKCAHNLRKPVQVQQGDGWREAEQCALCGRVL